MYKVIINIDGMACGMCETHVNDAIRNIYPKAKKLSSSHTKKMTTFLSETEADEEQIRNAITNIGYTCLGITQEPYTRRGLFG